MLSDHLMGSTVDENNLYETCLFLRDVQITLALCKNAFSQASHSLHHMVSVQETVQFGILFALTFREFHTNWLIISKLGVAGTCYVTLSTTAVSGRRNLDPYLGTEMASR